MHDRIYIYKDILEDYLQVIWYSWYYIADDAMGYLNNKTKDIAFQCFNCFSK